MKIISLSILFVVLLITCGKLDASPQNSRIVGKYDFEHENVSKVITRGGGHMCKVVSSSDLVLNGKHSLLINTLPYPTNGDKVACEIPFSGQGAKGARYEVKITYRILRKRSTSMSESNSSDFFVSVPWQGKKRIRSGSSQVNKVYTQTYNFSPQPKNKVRYVLMLGCKNGVKVVVDDIYISKLSAIPDEVLLGKPDIESTKAYMPYGIDIGKYKGNGFAAIDAAAEAGFEWVRINIQWRDFEPRAGSAPKPGWYDSIELAKYAKKKGLHIFLHIGNGFNPWQVTPYVKGAPEHAFARKVIKYKAWHRFLTAVVENFGGLSNHLQIMNEINNSGYYPSYSDYIKFYVDTAKFVKSIDPDMKMTPHSLGDGGMSSAKSPNVTNSLVKLYKGGAGPWIDFIDIHAYLNNVIDYVYYINRAYAVARNAGYPKTRIWISEAGMNLKNHTEKEQAEFVRDIYTYLLPNPHLDKVFIFSLLDTRAHRKYGIMYYRDGKLVPRQAYKEFKSMTKYTHDHRPINNGLINKAMNEYE